METVFRAMSIYVVLLLLFRIIGRRSASEMTQFDFVLVLILGESTQQALLGDDFSIINCFIVAATLLSVDYAISVVKHRYDKAERLLDGAPILLVCDGEFQDEAMRRERIDKQEVLETAREAHGHENLGQVKHAILEKSGKISVVPRDPEK